MWYEKTDTGKYRFREHYTDPATGKTRTVSVTMDRCTKQVQRIARQLLSEKMQEPVQERKLTLTALIDLYLADQSRIVKASTLNNASVLLRSLAKILGDVPIDRLTAGYVRRKLLDSGKEPGTCNHLMSRFKAMMRWAYRNDLVKDMACLDKLQTFKDVPRREKIQDKYLERDELETLVAGMRIDLWRDLTMFLALSGLRIGEAAALTRHDVDLKERMIDVSKNYDSINDIVTDTKTASSVRRVYMQDELFDLCKDLILKSKVIYMTDLLFSKDGQPIKYTTYDMYLKRISRQTIGRKITPHVLRHTHASLLMEAGMDIDSISARLGHSNSKVTRDIYLHVTEKLEAERNARMDRIQILKKV